MNINKFLLSREVSGVTPAAYSALFHNKEVQISSLFFNPITSKKEAFLKVTSVGTAPLALSFVALKCAAQSISELFQLIINQKENSQATAYLVAAGRLALAALVSSIVNLVDLIGSVLATLMSKPAPQSDNICKNEQRNTVSKDSSDDSCSNSSSSEEDSDEEDTDEEDSSCSCSC